ncbi:TIGR01777 family oxidoreductase [Sphingobacterium griseoflavum]|uniref:NAD-dependent epimerase n=1 Tax=Sphingobacterium griseoflavum TaxID=1474952 RepID=A0ABQ3HVM2_9SPHI|nr:TIGR01777 family oxidoreductase [Sphingobacterium griseoflavum]GHE32537.1 NAD-dependent epimerase [Sphingobacterium griseoflavum]
MKNILISGGTGFIGRALTSYLLDNYLDAKLTILVRSKHDLPELPRVTYCLWDVKKKMIDASVPDDIDTVIHLAGANISAKRWTRSRKQVLLDSRTESGKLLVDWVLGKGKAVQTFISASAIGWYGEGAPGTIFTEHDPAGHGFLANVCQQWEAATSSLATQGIRTAWIRTGLVLHPTGGMWKALSPAFRCNVAPRFASGKQCFSWIALADLVSLYAYVADHDNIAGPINAVSPHPVAQIELTKSLIAKQKSSFIVLPVPRFMLRLALGELSIELIKNANVSADKIQQMGFRFSAPILADLPD